MVVGFGQQLDASRLHQFAETLDDFGRVGLELVQRRAGNGETDLEQPAVPADQFEQQGVHGQIALAGHLEENAAVRVLVLIEGIHPDVEKGVVPQAVRLMNLTVEADRGHINSPPERVAHRRHSDDRPRFPTGCS